MTVDAIFTESTKYLSKNARCFFKIITNNSKNRKIVFFSYFFYVAFTQFIFKFILVDNTLASHHLRSLV